MGIAIGDITYDRFHIDLSTGDVRRETVNCEDVDDVLGGIARGFKVLEDRAVADAYAPEATLLLNLGLLSGTEFMTGLRTFFHAYSPLKTSLAGAPAPMWTAGSGKFGTKLRHLGVQEVLFTGRAERPMLLHIKEGPEFELLDASDLSGKHINDKIQTLHARYKDAHFAVLGPAGENYEGVRYAAIGLSTVNQLRSGDPKARYCGRGGIGGVMGSKNLLAIAADCPDPKGAAAPDGLKDLNMEVARGRGSQRFRDKDKGDGGGGTWANWEGLDKVHAVPEMNFNPTGTDVSFQLERPNVEQGPFVIKDESCYRCGIKCHKNLYDKDENGKAGKFRAKFDYEPLNLMSANIGIFDADTICDLVTLVDELGMDAISLGASLSYAMEYNRRHPDAPIAEGLTFGDAKKTAELIERIGTGAFPEIGQGTKRLSEQTGETGYAMHCKGVEFPAYLPQTNPGYPWALAGGHMSMQTYLLLLYEKETGLDYWVDAITRRGPMAFRDDLTGLCKFSGLSNKKVAAGIEMVTGLQITADDIKEAVMRTFVRGYKLERAQGFTVDDYNMPAEVHDEYPNIKLPHFNTKEFFAELRDRVLAKLDEMAAV
ncbi:MAG: aldehyde ferredoxin oxidoreductase C-terminal domain-containing protein [Planctomycetota bacterium]|jgi:aldehyde:ferredoxin oxidoreductase